MGRIRRHTLKSPWGPVLLESRGGDLLRVTRAPQYASAVPRSATEDLTGTPGDAAAHLREYFRTGAWTPWPEAVGGSEFDRTVYRELSSVPAGQVVSYGELARRVGRAGAARAVGGALARNPLLMLVPCHRVVRADGAPGGFAAGADWKKALLEHEGCTIKEGRVIAHD
jgi:methylated-DNA-[protein]-cysteine S-methyltransferase